MNFKKADFEFETLETKVLQVAQNEEVITIFNDMASWLNHLIKHFGERSEPWAKCLSLSAEDMGKVYSLRDRIHNQGGVAYLEKIIEKCQKCEPDAVDIYKKGKSAYATVAPKIADMVEGGVSYPRYAVIHARQIKGAKTKRFKEPFVYLITEPCAAFAAIRWHVLRTVYFPRRVISSQGRLLAAQMHLYQKIGKNIEKGKPISWYDGGSVKKYIAHPEDVQLFTRETLFGMLKRKKQ